MRIITIAITSIISLIFVVSCININKSTDYNDIIEIECVVDTNSMSCVFTNKSESEIFIPLRYYDYEKSDTIIMEGLIKDDDIDYFVLMIPQMKSIMPNQTCTISFPMIISSDIYSKFMLFRVYTKNVKDVEDAVMKDDKIFGETAFLEFEANYSILVESKFSIVPWGNIPNSDSVSTVR